MSATYVAALSMNIVYAIICGENVSFGAYYADQLVIISLLYESYAEEVSIQGKLQYNSSSLLHTHRSS